MLVSEPTKLMLVNAAAIAIRMPKKIVENTGVRKRGCTAVNQPGISLSRPIA